MSERAVPIYFASVADYLCLPKSASDHLQCRPEDPGGCPRCVYLPAVVCCEMCTPSAFVDFAPVDPHQRPAVAPHRSRVVDYKADEQDKALRMALHDYHKCKTEQKYGLPALYDIGPSLYMTNDVLDRITDCAHFNKIQNGEDLRRETRWTWVNEDVDEMLEIIRRFPQKSSAVPLTTTTPLQPRPAPPQPLLSGSPIATKRRNRCSSCKQEGHIGVACSGDSSASTR